MDEARESLEEAEYCLALIESVTDLIAVVDSEGSFIYVSQSFEPVLGYAPSELVGSSAFDLVHPDDLSETTGAFATLVADRGGSIAAEYRYRHKDGSYRTFEARGANLLQDEPARGIVVIARDVTEREKALESARARYLTCKNVVDSTDDPILSLDTEYRYTTFNPAHAAAMRELYGAEVQLGRNSLEYMTVAEDREHAKRNIDRALTGERVVVEAYSGEEGRSRRCFEIIHNPLRSDDSIVGVTVFARDITDRKWVEEELKQSEERFRSLFDNMLEGFAYCRMLYDDAGQPVDWVYVETNKAFGPLTGLENVVGKRVTEAIPGIRDTNPELFEMYGRVASGGEPARFEVHLEALERDLYIKAFSPREGYFVAVFENVTDRKKAERELRRTNAELTGFAQTVSHDLKGPLSAIALSASLAESLLEEADLTSREREGVNEALLILKRNADRGGRLVDDLLVLAEAGQIPARVEPVDIDEVVAQILDEKKAVVREKGVSVNSADDLGSVIASPTHMYQLFGNLIDNAIRHGKAARPKIDVLRLTGDGTRVHHFLVRDNGPGIPDEAMDRIFTPFFKGAAGDTGVGLATVEKIVGVYGGKIRAYNDGGACFEFSLADASPGVGDGSAATRRGFS